MNELLEQLKTNRILIFGTGFVAERFLSALISLGLSDRVDGFVVSERTETERFRGYPVFEWNGTLPDNTVLCLAVHDTVLAGLPSLLRQRGLRIYPYLHELLFGTQTEQRSVTTAQLLSWQNTDEYWLAVRMLGLEGICENSEEKKELYRKAMSAHCSPETAAGRLEKLELLFQDVCESGIKDPILIDEEGRIIDGLHRLAISVYLGIKTIPCGIYQSTPLFETVFPENNRLPSRFLDTRFTAREKELLQGAQDRLYGPLVTMILPVYNVEAYIDQCMETVVHQSWRKLEILLINDGSEDQSADRCRNWERKDRRIRLLNQENHGVSFSRNRGIEEATGEYLAFADPDDWLDLQYIEKLVTCALKTGSPLTECDLWRYDNRTGKNLSGLLRSDGGSLQFRGTHEIRPDSELQSHLQTSSLDRSPPALPRVRL